MNPDGEGRTGTYRLYAAAEQLLYVGVGDLPATRWQDHRTHKTWWSDVDHATVKWWPTRAEALADEANAIANENPLHNIEGTGKRRKKLGPPFAPGTVLVGSQEIAVRLDISRQRVRQIGARDGFPEPIATISNGRIWRADDVEAWIAIERAEWSQ